MNPDHCPKRCSQVPVRQKVQRVPLAARANEPQPANLLDPMSGCIDRAVRGAGDTSGHGDPAPQNTADLGKRGLLCAGKNCDRVPQLMVSTGTS
jgi:hypothetical protein